MNTIDRYLERNANFASKFSSREGLSAAPTQRVAIVACMDARVDTFALLGMESGDAYLAYTNALRGFVYHVETGRLREVD